MLIDPATVPPPAGLSATAFSSLFQAVNGLRDRRAIVALLACAVAGVLLASLLLTMAGALGFVAGLLATLVWFVAIGTGINAAGLLQMDSARGISQRSTVDALVHGLLCIPKLLVLALAFFAVVVVVFIAIALLLLVTKIPFLGPLLFVLVFPLSVVAAGLTVVGAGICMVLSLPAIWQGASITRALAQTLTIVRSRLVEAVLLLVFVAFLCFVVGFIVFGVLGTGLLPTLGLSASIVGFGGLGDMGSLMGAAQGFAGAGGAGHMLAGAVGGALLWAVAGSLVGQVYLRGLSLVYLRVTEGLDLSGTEAVLRAALDEARRRTNEIGDKAKSAASRDAVPPPVAPAQPFAPTPPPTPSMAAAEPVTAPFPASMGVPVAAAGTAGAALGAAAVGPDAFRAPAPPLYNPPPAYSAAPPRADIPLADEPPDIELPFGDPADDGPETVPPAMPSYAAPPAWAPPPVQPSPPVAEPAPAATTCAQCLSPVAGDDVFCGVCGYRLK